MRQPPGMRSGVDRDEDGTTRTSASHRGAAAVGLALACLGALAACSSSPGSASPPTSTTTSAPASTSTTAGGSGGTINGPEIDQLPTVPGPTTSPPTPDLSTVAGQTAFLRRVFGDIQSVWNATFAKAGITYGPARLVLFRSTVSTACGDESADVGPFYCSGDRTVYLDIRFFSAMEARFGVKGDFAEAYVVAHEVGHHIQNLVGITSRVAAAERATPASANALSVRVELQADCLAGVWAHSTYARNLLEPGDIQQALHAAQVIGDDFLAHAAGSPVDPDSWTHGSSAQRTQWFTTGFTQGGADACDTFAGL